MTAIALEQVQANILLPYTRANCGRMLCVHFESAEPDHAPALEAARAWLRAVSEHVTFHSAVRDANGAPTESGNGPWFNVGLTYAGLQALGSDPFTLKYLPTAFAQGMGARRARLGDASDAPTHTGGAVHAVLFCYAYDDAVEAQAQKVGAAAYEWRPLDVDAIKDLEYAVARALTAPLHAMLQLPGVRYLPDLERDLYRLSAGELTGVEYFGFRDGVSQPRIHGVPSDGSALPDTAPGAVLLGYPTPKQSEHEPDVRDDETRAQLALTHLANGSFLVVRDLSQDVDGFRRDLGDKAAAIPGLRATELAEHMMGRRRDGTPLALPRGTGLDDFTYDQDPEGRGCPFQAHTRRVNPRDDRARVRRLMRRGVPTSRYRQKRSEQGLLFLAFNADIEGQFEFVQRQWINGGAESHGLSVDRDPIAADLAPARTAPAGGSFSFVWALDERPHTVTGLHSYVHAGWGEYVLVPSRRTLAELSVAPNSALAEYQSRVTDIDDIDLRRDVLGRWLDDPNTCRRVFAEVRACGGAVRLARDAVVLVGCADLVETVVHDDGRTYSVGRQGEAMRQTTGAFYLGMDAYTDEYQRDSAASSVLIPGWKDGAQHYDSAGHVASDASAAQDAELMQVRKATAELCHAFFELTLVDARASYDLPGTPERGKLALDDFTAFVLSGLTPKLFGVPQPSAQGTFTLNVPHSGYIFFAFPEASFVEFAAQAAQGVGAYLAQLFAQRDRRRRHSVFPEDADALQSKPPPRSSIPPGQEPDQAWQGKLNSTLEQLEQLFAKQGRECTVEDRVRMMAGVISGMLITSFKLFTDGVTDYVKSFELDTRIALDPDPKQVARLPFLTMKRNQRSMPNIVYRKARATVPLGDVTVAAGDFVLASQGSAMADSGSDWFYGDRTPNAGERPLSPHFCPGYLVANAIIETMSQQLFLGLPDLRRGASVDKGHGPATVLTYDWSLLQAAAAAARAGQSDR